jgi:SAM-dependent methyltransferase
MGGELSSASRLVSLLDYLGLKRVHVAAMIPGDISGLAAIVPDRLAGVVLCTPVFLDAAPFTGVADRLLILAGEYGPTFQATLRAADRLPGTERQVLDGYEAQTWSDVAADRTEDVTDRITGFLSRFVADQPRYTATEGNHAGISYRIEGSGPALLLLPFFHAPSQWTPAIPALSRHFTVVMLGGRHLGGIALLEDRARAPSCRAMFRTLIDIIAPVPGEAILDIGCGAGSLDRLLAQRLGGANLIDANPYYLSEGAALAAEEGLAAAIHFTPGNAESLPFADHSFNAVFSVTLLEECDADRAIAEMVRVVTPGGGIGIIVCSLDLPQWWNLDLPESIRQKIARPPRSIAAKGVADATLYRRMRRSGLNDLVCFPSLLTLDRPGGGLWRPREDYALSLLTAEELPIWRAAYDRAAEDEVLMTAWPFHCGRDQARSPPDRRLTTMAAYMARPGLLDRCRSRTDLDLSERAPERTCRSNPELFPKGCCLLD